MTTIDESNSPSGLDRPASGHNGDDGFDESASLAVGTPEYFENPLHYGIEHGMPWPDDVPHGQDDTHWRYEHDPRGARIAELRIAACFMITLLSGIGLAASYVTGGQAQIEGALLFAGFFALGVGFVLWARDLLPGHEVTASRGGLTHTSDEENRAAAVQALGRGIEPMARRPFLGKMLGAVMTIFGLGILFPLASLGPRVHGQFAKTPWDPNRRAVTEDGNPVKPSQIEYPGVLTVFPDTGIDPTDPTMAQASTILINLGPASTGFEIRPGRETWYIGAVGSETFIVGFSKICTHAGCPVSLYDTLSQELVCPCHQSTFSVLQDAKPIFGPAPRNLAQLALSTDAEGYIVSQHGYTEPVGPGYWNRPNTVKPT